MEIARISVPLVFSRLGEMISSLFYFSFIGNFFVSSLSHASLAWALVSFLAVVGIGFFSASIVKVAGSKDLNKDNIAQDLNISFRYAIFFGGFIIICLSIYNFTDNSPESAEIPNTKIIVILAMYLPAYYIQLIIFNFFNSIKKPQHELISIGLFNLSLIITGALFAITETKAGITYFMSIYVVLKWFFTALAIKTFNQNIRLYVYNFRHRDGISRDAYISYFINGLPLALCLGGESLLFFIFTIISKNIDNTSLAAYQATLHFLSIVYMISIGVANGTGIIAARHFTSGNFSALLSTYFQGLKFGLLVLTPFLFASFVLSEYIARLYTSDIPTRQIIEKNIPISIPFLLFEYVYIVTRTTLRSMGDFWIPAIITISTLNILGLSFFSILFLSYGYSVNSIFLTLAFCSLILMVLLLSRLNQILRPHILLHG